MHLSKSVSVLFYIRKLKPVKLKFYSIERLKRQVETILTRAITSSTDTLKPATHKAALHADRSDFDRAGENRE